MAIGIGGHAWGGRRSGGRGRVGGWSALAASLGACVVSGSLLGGCASEQQTWQPVSLASSVGQPGAAIVTGSLDAGSAANGAAIPAPMPAAVARQPWPEPKPVQPSTVVAAVPTSVSQPRTPPRRGGVYKIGKPYEIRGTWYHPKHEPDYDQQGMASYYGRSLQGSVTANGETYDEVLLTAAHPTLPLPSLAYVTNLANGRTVMVRVNDRGPFVKGRIIDLSLRAAELLGMKSRGVGKVRVKYAGRAPLDGNDAREQGFVAQQAWATVVPVRPQPQNQAKMVDARQ